MHARLPPLIGGLTLATLIACGSTAPRSGGTASVGEGLAALETVRAVLQHPRCRNCHPAGEVPLQYDAGLEHGQMVTRGADGKGAPGMECGTCHGTSNPPASYGPRVPPGAPNWHLPPAKTPMVFEGRSSAELAKTLADPAQNGGKSLEQMLEHVASDPLVLWGWNPGGDRAPVPVAHEEFVRAFRAWVAAGAPGGT
jgi:hypothetical protein